MRIRLSELRRVIRSTIRECYGWPVESESHLYGTPTKIDVENPRDPKNPGLKLPKGPNSRATMGESFQRISSQELSAWKKGNFESINESEGSKDPCEACGTMVSSGELEESDGKEYVCSSCRGK